ncbi:hypothetical protein B0T18DRAFT_397844 [Schizothecium vesticola]|uniref:F-box domain-containing protein n=1 Tax=Schizothecium vesticola TaxID=314040 RepID=A0AA40FAP8_9PEZI|nr:hypothetical protein B0T18DRAFT_397844 [Schizothecium vesticola]
MATTEPLIPCLLVPLGPAKPVAIYHPRDHEFAMRTQRASAKMQQITDAHSNLLPLSYMNASAMNIIPTPRPTGPPPGIPRSMPPPMPPPAPAIMERPTLQVHRRQNSSSSVSSTGSSIVWGRESFESRHQSASLSSSRTSLDSLPPYSPGSRSPSTAHYQLKGYPWQRPAPIKTIRRQVRPGELFSLLPGDVLELILQELRALHTRSGGDSCETCWMRDCCAIALSGRKFVKYAREALYQHIYLVGDEGPQMRKRMKMDHGCRLTLLRRTLRVNNRIAVIVRSIKPPAKPLGVGSVEYNDLVASVVMACPSLERLVGFYPGHDHSFQRLFQALSTRKRLKDMNWILEPAKTHRMSRSQSITPVGESFQSFAEFHLNWRNLTTLVVHGQPGATLAPGALEQALRYLPSLQTLHISSLPSASFNDSTLASLPPLKKLTLSRLPGVTTAGLSAFATRAGSTNLTTLTLHHMNVETLPALARLFSNLKRLDTFNICQVYAPIMPTDELVWLFPYLASHSLRRLHWDIPYLPTRATTADRILAESIRAGGFPALRAIRAPNDPKGIFQALCRPRNRISDSIDRYRAGQDWGHGHSLSSPQLGRGLVHHARSASSDNCPQHHTRSMSGTSLSTATWPHPSPPASLDALMMPRDNSDLHQARLAAQARLEGARRYPRFCIDVIDDRGRVVEKYGVGAFLGTAGSRISYVLTPDDGGTDEGGGLVGIADMMRDGGEGLAVAKPEVERSWRGSSRKEKAGEGDGERRIRSGCCGRWNAQEVHVAEKKDRERWLHVERGRWKGVELS